MRERGFVILLMMIMVIIGVGRAYGGERVILLDSSDVRATSPRDSTSAQSYVITFAIPERMGCGWVHRAVLELYADVAGYDTDAYQSESVLVEVYGISGPVDGEFEPEQLQRPSAMTRNVVVGANRRVLVDITEFMRYNILQEISTPSLVVGFVRARDGVFRIREDAFGDGRPACLTIIELPTGGSE
jgi:hypothetical protein